MRFLSRPHSGGSLPALLVLLAAGSVSTLTDTAFAAPAKVVCDRVLENFSSSKVGACAM